jgi:hypothetical protein
VSLPSAFAAHGAIHATTAAASAAFASLVDVIAVSFRFAACPRETRRGMLESAYSPLDSLIQRSVRGDLTSVRSWKRGGAHPQWATYRTSKTYKSKGLRRDFGFSMKRGGVNEVIDDLDKSLFYEQATSTGTSRWVFVLWSLRDVNAAKWDTQPD